MRSFSPNSRPALRAAGNTVMGNDGGLTLTMDVQVSTAVATNRSVRHCLPRQVRLALTSCCRRRP